jgi:hypothetical protein
MFPDPSTTEWLCELLISNRASHWAPDGDLEGGIRDVLRGKDERTVVGALCRGLQDRGAVNTFGANIFGESIDELGEIGFREAVPHLLALCNIPDLSSIVRDKVIRALGSFVDDARIIAPLVAALQDKESSVRFYAIQALSKTKDVRAIEPLTAMLSDKEMMHGDLLAEVAAKALAKLGCPEVLGAVVPLMKSPDNTVRRNVVIVLGLMGSPDTLPVLCAVLNDTDAWVRNGAAKSLLSAIQKGEPLDQPSKVVDLSLQNYCTAKYDWEKATMASLIGNLVEKSVRDLETDLLVRIEALRDADVILFEYWGTDDSGDRYGERKSIPLQFSKTRMAASSELARRGQKRTESDAIIREFAAHSDSAGGSQNRSGKPRKKGWLVRLLSRSGRR